MIEAEARAREKGPTWVYQLNFPNPRDGGRYGAHHTLDIPLVFANTAKSEAQTGDSEGAQEGCGGDERCVGALRSHRRSVGGPLEHGRAMILASARP